MIPEPQDKAIELLKRQEFLENDRSTLDAHCEEIAQRIFPSQRGFIQRFLTKGQKKQEYVYDSAAGQALNYFAAAMEGMLTPRVQRWHTLRATDESLNRRPDVVEWMQGATRTLFVSRNHSNFSDQKGMDYRALGAFGSSSMFVEDMTGAGALRYRTEPLARTWFMEDAYGRVTTVHRKLYKTAAQLEELWGDAVPAEVLEKKSKNPTETFEVLHVVRPNKDRDPKRLDWKGMPFYSCYVLCKEKIVLSEGGFHSWPFPISRWVVMPGEVYGESVAMSALPDIKMLNEMARTVIRAGQKQVDPALLVHDDGILGGPVSTQPNALNYGGVSADGRPLVQPLQTGGRVDLGFELMQEKKAAIREAFYVTVFQILLEGGDRMTATEVLKKVQDQGIILAPTAGRQQTETLGPLIHRELDLLMRAGKIPPPPPVLVEAQGEYDIVYDNLLTRAQEAEEALGLARTLEAIAPIIQTSANPDRVVRRLDADKILVALARTNALPQDWLRSDDELAAMDQAEQEAAQRQEAIQAGPALGTTVQKLAQAAQQEQ